MFNWLYKGRISKKRKKKKRNTSRRGLTRREDREIVDRGIADVVRPRTAMYLVRVIMLLDKLKRTLKAKCGRRTERNASCKTGWVDGGVEGG